MALDDAERSASNKPKKKRKKRLEQTAEAASEAAAQASQCAASASSDSEGEDEFDLSLLSATNASRPPPSPRKAAQGAAKPVAQGAKERKNTTRPANSGGKNATNSANSAAAASKRSSASSSSSSSSSSEQQRRRRQQQQQQQQKRPAASSSSPGRRAPASPGRRGSPARAGFVPDAVFLFTDEAPSATRHSDERRHSDEMVSAVLASLDLLHVAPQLAAAGVDEAALETVSAEELLAYGLSRRDADRLLATQSSARTRVVEEEEQRVEPACEGAGAQALSLDRAAQLAEELLAAELSLHARQRLDDSICNSVGFFEFGVETGVEAFVTMESVLESHRTRASRLNSPSSQSDRKRTVDIRVFQTKRKYRSRLVPREQAAAHLLRGRARELLLVLLALRRARSRARLSAVGTPHLLPTVKTRQFARPRRTRRL